MRSGDRGLYQRPSLPLINDPAGHPPIRLTTQRGRGLTVMSHPISHLCAPTHMGSQIGPAVRVIPNGIAQQFGPLSNSLSMLSRIRTG